MALTLRERPRVFLWLNGAAATVVLATGVYFYMEVVKTVPNIPDGGLFTDSFGAHILPDFIAWRAGLATHHRLTSLVKLSTFTALFLAMAGWFLFMVRWHDFRIALARLPDPEKIFLLIGAALIGGCFFTGSSNGYRGIHLLFTLPGLLAMARMKGATMNVRQLAVQQCVLVVALAWAGFFTSYGTFRMILESWIGSVPAGRLMRFLWFFNQIVWWEVATLFIAILIGLCFNQLAAVPEWRRLQRDLRARMNSLATRAN
jgi:hypothetical protein